RPHPEVTIPIKVNVVTEIGWARVLPTREPRGRPAWAGPFRVAWPPASTLRRPVPLDPYQVRGAAHPERHAGRDHVAVARLEEALLGDRARRRVDHLVGVVDVVGLVGDYAPGHGQLPLGAGVGGDREDRGGRAVARHAQRGRAA